jgi:tRNA(Ile)-lysidine synthase
MVPLVQKVGQFLRRIRFDGAATVVAVSGGPDSVALWHALYSLASAPLVIAHLNHQLRGPESDADEAFVRQLHDALAAERPSSVRLFVERAEVAAQAKAEGDNLEQVARKVRYEWLARVAREAGAAYVATGHTADDQAETVLHRLLRGAGLKGLRGIASRRSLGQGVELIRPLLEVSRAEVLDYLASGQLAYCQDRTNLDLRYTRNRIRHKLLPYLAEHYNPKIAAVLCRLAEQARGIYADVESAGYKLLAEAELPRAGKDVILDRARLAAAPRNLTREVFRLIWEREGWGMNGMDFRAWDRLAGLARGEVAAVDLPGGVQARCRERVVQLKRAE